MKNIFDTAEAARFCEEFAGGNTDLAMRVYTSRLIGAEESLVLHGGGNTSVKTTMKNILGDEVEGLFIKGSGWDLATIEEAGFPGLDLAWLKKLRTLSSLSDEDMVNQFRTHMFAASSPNPSIETLVHAFLPHKFIDHTHADAIVSLTHLPDGEDMVVRALGDRIGILPFIMPGFPLARAMAELYEARPGIEAVVLMFHGIFTFADDAEVAYGRMIDYVSRAEDFIAAGKPEPVKVEISAHAAEKVLPVVRGAVSRAAGQPMHLDLRDSAEIVSLLSRKDAAGLFATGVLTPDHVIRTKNFPLWLDLAGVADDEAAVRVEAAMLDYIDDYDAYFHRCSGNAAEKKIRLDPAPRLFLIPGIGLIAAGETVKAAMVCADIGEHTLRAKAAGAHLGRYADLGEGHIFAMEYWSLEQAKIGRGTPPDLAGQVALVSGGGGAIGVGIARQLMLAGARVFLSDIDRSRLETVRDLLAAETGTAPDILGMDVSTAASVRAGIAGVIRAAGGLDILVPNAGIAHVAKIEALDDDSLARVMAVNFNGVFLLIREAAAIFRDQGMGGNIVVNSSKNVFAPGAAFGAYSASKAAAHQMGKIAAMEMAEIGVRVNMINADAIFDDHGVSSGLWDVVGPDRMRSRNLDPEGLKEYYRQRNLLKTEITADDVGRAVVFFASGQTPTTGATLPVDGGVAAAFPR